MLCVSMVTGDGEGLRLDYMLRCKKVKGKFFSSGTETDVRAFFLFFVFNDFHIFITSGTFSFQSKIQQFG